VRVMLRISVMMEKLRVICLGAVEVAWVGSSISSIDLRIGSSSRMVS